MNQARKDIVRPGAASAPRILIVEDESDLSLLLGYNLESEGYLVENVERGDEAELRLAESAPDLVILDWMLPGVSGLEICRRLRARESTRTLPVIMVTARGEEAERVRGLSVGADDYVVKPFSPAELVARVDAVLRRTAPPASEEPPIERGPLRVEPATRRVFLDGEEVSLTQREFDLLAYLAAHPGRVYSRDQLMEAVWGETFFEDTSTVTVHIRRLRAKLGDEVDEPRFIETVWGVGYRFRA
jgi:two-component system phosphate regulon response regulator PhoB